MTHSDCAQCHVPFPSGRVRIRVIFVLVERLNEIRGINRAEVYASHIDELSACSEQCYPACCDCDSPHLRRSIRGCLRGQLASLPPDGKLPCLGMADTVGHIAAKLGV